jgi:chorismate mutase/prephenate dehydrogenase
VSELDRLRERLDALDGEIVARVVERLEIVRRIGAEKRAAGKPAFDREREREVRRSLEARATSLGLPRKQAHDLAGALLEASHALQAEEAGSSDAPRRLLIVGGRGKMGALFARLFAERGHAVDVLERGEPLEPARIEAADVVIVSVPMSEAERVTAALAPLVRDDALLCDVNSLKVGVCRALAACRGEALGTHPMFGPTVGSLRRQKIVLCPVREGPQSAWLAAELGHMGAELVRTDPASHDATMAIVQVLTHFGILAMGRALCRSGVPLAETLRFMSPIYRLEVAMIGRLFSQDPALYQEILMANPRGEAMRALLVQEAGALAERIAAGDRAGFQRSFQEVRAYFADFADEAMALSDHIIDAIMSRA